MEILKQCQICKQNIAKYTCQLCGKLVCENCYNKTGLCIACKKRGINDKSRNSRNIL